MPRPFTMIATLFINLVSLGHFLRVVTAIDLIIGGFSIPLWMSAVAGVFCAGLAFMLYKERWS